MCQRVHTGESYIFYFDYLYAGHLTGHGDAPWHTIRNITQTHEGYLVQMACR